MSMKTENYRVLVTPTSFGRDDPDLKRTLENQVGEVIYNEKGRPLTAAELVERMGNVDGFIAGLDDISREVILSGDRLQVIARYGVGVDNVDLDAAAERGIRVTNTPGANSGSVAELAVAFMLSLARPLIPAARATREGRWPRLKEFPWRIKPWVCLVLEILARKLPDVWPGLDAGLQLTILLRIGLWLMSWGWSCLPGKRSFPAQISYLCTAVSSRRLRVW